MRPGSRCFVPPIVPDSATTLIGKLSARPAVLFGETPVPFSFSSRKWGIYVGPGSTRARTRCSFSVLVDRANSRHARSGRASRACTFIAKHDADISPSIGVKSASQKAGR